MANSVADCKVEKLHFSLAAFNSFVNFARKNKVDGKLVETIGYFLGPERNNKNYQVIDTVVIPEQIGKISSVEDNGCDGKYTLDCLKDDCPTGKKIVAWAHTRTPGYEKCICTIFYGYAHTIWI